MSDLDPLGEEWKSIPTADDLETKHNRKPLAILGVAALAAVLMMSFTVFKKSVVYYKTPHEVMASPNWMGRLSGTVVPGSIATDQASGVTTFEVLDPDDKTTVVAVSYSGTVPDTLKDNAQAVAEGEYTDGVFEATTLFAKCPSKFQASTSPGA
jgi:cytochrome c-type biogenesis protein CcmE